MQLPGLVVRAEGEALPHRDLLGRRHPGPQVVAVLRVGDVLGPIAEAAHELVVVVRIARGQVELAVRLDRPDRARRHAELALQARVVRGRPRRLGHLGLEQDRPEQDEVAELGMDDVPMDAHHPQAGGHGHRLVGHHPHPVRPAVGLHRERHRRVHGAAPPAAPTIATIRRATSLTSWPTWWNSAFATDRWTRRTGSRFIRQTMLMSVLRPGEQGRDDT